MTFVVQPEDAGEVNIVQGTLTLRYSAPRVWNVAAAPMTE